MTGPKTGPQAPILAIVDFGFDLKNPDLLENIYIDQAEFNGGVQTTGHTPPPDLNHDSLADFFDLNNDPASLQEYDCDHDGRVTPLDVIGPGPCGLANGNDENNNGALDDLCGYDVADNDNNAHNADVFHAHGTEIMSLIGARGLSVGCGAASGIAGVNWRARLLPVKIAPDDLNALAAQTGLTRFSTLFSSIHRGVQYAADTNPTPLNVEVVNLSMSATLVEVADGQTVTVTPSLPPACAGDPHIFQGIKPTKFSLETELIGNDGADLNLGNSIVVVSAGSCPYDETTQGVLDVFTNWGTTPPVVSVTGVDAKGSFTGAFNGNVTMAAPSQGFEVEAPGFPSCITGILPCANGMTSVAGVSGSAALVSGTLGLLLATDPGEGSDQVEGRLFCSDPGAHVQRGVLNALKVVTSSTQGCP